MPAAKNILNREFNPERPNEKWVADITYIRTHEGWSYLAVVMDLYARCIVGWAMSKRIDAKLACDALNNAIRARKPGPGLLHLKTVRDGLVNQCGQLSVTEGQPPATFVKLDSPTRLNEGVGEFRWQLELTGCRAGRGRERHYGHNEPHPPASR